MIKMTETEQEFERLRKLNSSNDIIAKILAKENLTTVYSRSARTAMFDPVMRQVVIPLWNVNEITSLMLRIHEVSHALFTPTMNSSGRYFSFHDEEDQKSMIPKRILDKVNFNTFFHYMNVVEDDRIERTISTQYPGIRNILRTGHQNLFKMGFYAGITKSNKMNDLLCNKALIYSRFGTNSPVEYSLSDDEREILSSMVNNKTFEDVIELAYEMYMFDKHNVNQPPPKKQDEQKEQGEGDDSKGDSDPGLDFSDPDESKQTEEPEESDEESKDNSGSNSESSEEQQESEDGSGSSNKKQQSENENEDFDRSESEVDSDDLAVSKYYNSLKMNAPTNSYNIIHSSSVFAINLDRDEILRMESQPPF